MAGMFQTAGHGKPQMMVATATDGTPGTAGRKVDKAIKAAGRRRTWSGATVRDLEAHTTPARAGTQAWDGKTVVVGLER